MSGIYIHIPYCHKACNYCNFHFSTSLKDVGKMIDSICIELEQRKDYMNGQVVETIYFGGGTPSILSDTQLKSIFTTIYTHFSISSDIEITIEANPEDISANTLINWKEVGINRLSIGIQSFQDHYLKWMNRNHTSAESLACITLAQEHGFDNISIDLIYGLPDLSVEQWEEELDTAIGLNVSHISTYCLTVEEKTALSKDIEKGTIQLNPEETLEKQMLLLMNKMEHANFEQYEISNFCKPRFESKHNSSYWKRQPYLGVGPGAHSYNKTSRQYNVSNNPLYIKYISSPSLGHISTIEELSQIDQYNEYILTRLRTKWGVELNDIYQFSSINHLKVNDLINSFTVNGFLEKHDNVYLLTLKGKLLADEITLQLMV